MLARVSTSFSSGALRSSQQLLFASSIIVAILIISPLSESFSPRVLFLLSLLPAYGLFYYVRTLFGGRLVQREARLSGQDSILDAIPQRDKFFDGLDEAGSDSLIGFGVEQGEPITIDFGDLLAHVAISSPQGELAVGAVESILLQQLARGGAHGALIIDSAPLDSTLSRLTAFARLTGRVDDLIVIDPGHSPHSFNPIANCLTTDEKIRFVLGLLHNSRTQSDLPTNRDTLVEDCVARMIKTLDSFGRPWHLGDLAAALENFSVSYSILRSMAQSTSNTQALMELGHIGSAFRTSRGSIDTEKLAKRVASTAEKIAVLLQGELRETLTASHSTLDIYRAIEAGQFVYVRAPHYSRYSGQALISAIKQELDLAMIDRVGEEPHRSDDPFLCCLLGFGDADLASWRGSLELASPARIAFVYSRDGGGDYSSNTHNFRDQLAEITGTKLEIGFGEFSRAKSSGESGSKRGGGVVSGLGRPNEVKTRTLEPLPRVASAQRLEISQSKLRSTSIREPLFTMFRGRDSVIHGRLTQIDLESNLQEEFVLAQRSIDSDCYATLGLESLIRQAILLGGDLESGDGHDGELSSNLARFSLRFKENS